MKDYREKIQEFSSLVERIKRMRQGKTVVLCHGTFDIVHPGHIRHLQFAKQKGDILIVSLTADEMVQKGKDRPYITEDLRAENLAALEMVDAVYIDYNETPISRISELKPDVFVKGYEYDGSRPESAARTQEEMQTVSSYGGKMLFSPGDAVFSSSVILLAHSFNVSLEKISAMLHTQGINRDDILATVDGIQGVKVLVMGDTIVDKYTYCNILGASNKSATFSVSKEQSETFIGGAGIVARNMAEFGADVHFLSLVGDDAAGEYVVRNLPGNNLSSHFIVDGTRPTTVKQVFIANSERLLQVDELDNSPVSGDFESSIRHSFQSLLSEVQAVVFSDFRHGLLHKQSIPWFVETARKAGKTIIADSQVASRWGNVLDYRGADLLCGTETEIRFALGDQDVGLIALGRRCLMEAGAKNLILKLGAKGLIAFEYPRGANKEFYPIDTFASHVVDVMGAGDALLSAAAPAHCQKAPLLVISFIGSCAAALAVKTRGNIPVGFSNLRSRVVEVLDAMGL